MMKLPQPKECRWQWLLNIAWDKLYALPSLLNMEDDDVDIVFEDEEDLNGLTEEDLEGVYAHDRIGCIKCGGGSCYRYFRDIEDIIKYNAEPGWSCPRKYF